MGKRNTQKPRRPVKSSFKPRFTAWFDGCCEPVNPGGTASYGAVIFDNGERAWDCSKIFFPEKGKENATSNNVAEYSGMIAILEWLRENGFENEPTLIRGDSRLVIDQCFGNWRIKAGHYVPLALHARKMLDTMPNVYGKWIPREENEIADELSKAELVKAGVEFRIQPNG